MSTAIKSSSAITLITDRLQYVANANGGRFPKEYFVEEEFLRDLTREVAVIAMAKQESIYYYDQSYDLYLAGPASFYLTAPLEGLAVRGTAIRSFRQ